MKTSAWDMVIGAFAGAVVGSAAIRLSELSFWVTVLLAVSVFVVVLVVAPVGRSRPAGRIAMRLRGGSTKGRKTRIRNHDTGIDAEDVNMDLEDTDIA